MLNSYKMWLKFTYSCSKSQRIITEKLPIWLSVYNNFDASLPAPLKHLDLRLGLPGSQNFLPHASKFMKFILAASSSPGSGSHVPVFRWLWNCFLRQLWPLQILACGDFAPLASSCFFLL